MITENVGTIFIVVYCSGGHEYGWPESVFSTEEDAKEYAKANPTSKEMGESYTANIDSYPVKRIVK